MIKYLKNLLLLGVIATALTLVSCGDDDGDSGGNITGSLVGTWTGGTATVNSFTINGEDVSVFLEQYRDLLIESEEFTEEEADAFLEFFEEILIGGFTETFEGTITFNEDGTYESTDSEFGTETGTWELSGSTLTIDGGTEDELDVEVVSLTDSRFEGTIKEDVSEDLDGDGTSDDLSIDVTIVFTR